MGARLKIILVLTSIILLNHICTTQVGDGFVNHYTFRCELCCDTCSMHDSGYYRCNTRDGWDYCSVWENTDYRGNECRDDHPCEKHGRDYYWCYNKAGGWGYCGKVEPKNQSKDECLFEPCNDDHPCDTHGENYTLRRTISSWNFSGLIQNGGDNNTRHQERQPNDLQIICTHTDRGNKKQTRICAKPNPRDIVDGTTWRNEISNITSKWNNSYLGNQPKSGLIKTKNLRIDLQEVVNRTTLPYYNLQIQLNVPRQCGRSTTVAQVFIPQNEDIPVRYVRRAFKESSDRRARVFVDVIHGVSPVIRPGQNCG